MNKYALSTAPREARPAAVLPLAPRANRTGRPPRLRFGTKVLVALLVTLAVVLALHDARFRQPSPPPRSCEIALVTHGAVEGLLSAPGQLFLDRKLEVRSDGPGRVVAVSVRAGDRVAAGQVLARLDDLGERMALVAAGAKVTSATLLNLRAERQLWEILESMRNQGLLAPPIDPEAVMDGAAGDAQLELIHTGVQGAKEKAALTLARAARARRTIRAPAAGLIVAQSAVAGQSIVGGVGGEPLFVIDGRPGRLRLEAEVDERYLPALAPGPATFTTPAHGSTTFAATIESVVPRLGVRSPAPYAVVLSVDDPSRALVPGMTVVVDLPARSPGNATHVPTAALRSSPGQAATTIWIPRQDGRAAAVPVEVGVTGAGLTEIRAPGIGAGQVVVVDPSPEACAVN